ncbi:acid phosphatase [Corynebacterium pseudotuberculosis]|uniref:Phosphatase PAP2 family protein n=1 Tax=Corynebacterium pseudotuberculosis (strain C231) TaxID=681645 RepID=D9QEE1_CORP2|nr:phosphatase PAP2 family protein [Corynebacterium pseudotuberculosis]ADL09864.1 phosphatase PAP2 family protein [Corynebacterium pseudotuberculosis C231]ADO25657.1 phosphatase PAP2 family protein [Corynebacterium pseudotuberculosis I19]AEP69636.1 PAP2 superfamily protein [Corynebacterium pseudotuberculosis 42/02-A]AFF21528.1 PAP2 superfamily protein [Corynebacterium pseudotuberculosis P54B96]AFH51292.1 PAP2 superfamily protein [Corynebacterium pseudotuberculosis 267]
MSKTKCRLLGVLSSATFILSLVTPVNAQPVLQVPSDSSVGASLASPSVLHPGAPIPQPFGPADYIGYISDISSYSGGIYYDVVSNFEDLRQNHPKAMEENSATSIRINNEATAESVARAQRDALTEHDGVLVAFSDALGPRLGEHLRTALAENRLPKLQMLLGGWTARAGGLASSTFVEKNIFRNPRPYIAHAGSIRQYRVSHHDLYPTSGSFPSGHTNQATWTTALWAYMLPEFSAQILDRGSEAGFNRVVLGVHYPLDVIGGRMTGNAAAADRLNDPKMRIALDAAAAELRAELEWRCGKSLLECATDTRSKEQAVQKYTERMTYGMKTRVYSSEAPMVVPQAAPVLLASAFPSLTWGQRAEVLRQTAFEAGYPLDDQSTRGSWQRINLARAMAASVTVGANGVVSVN